ncbi:BamA/TamA family outer membrane protein [Ferruginibacter albus]|uniref:BamA/TamA family outer membrane protein n=1 Tax=Ferruginibacter albus TaxID=2875540 RepID=UPI001CC791B6|nr:BamA/TamA family outer membrane protein [Ferruginibacter albus]UAY53288.1 BamA/TamA family outer membrane protein [Ferruginibacter albus]
MTSTNPGKVSFFNCLKCIFFISILLSACYIPRKYQKDKPFVFKNTIEIKGGQFDKDERSTLKQRLYAQLDDSSKITVKDAFFVLHYIDNPPAYDSNYSAISAKNIKVSMMHVGYYNAVDSFKADTAKVKGQKRVSVTYTVTANNPTKIDTISYNLTDSNLEKIAQRSMDKSLLVKGDIITKDNVLGEIARLVDTFRNNGYYKFSTEDIKVVGDTTIPALTNVSDNPFENLAAIEEAKEKRAHPTIKLAIVLNPLADSNRLKKYYINNVFIYPDFHASDSLGKTVFLDTLITREKHIIQYHDPKQVYRRSWLFRAFSSRRDTTSRRKFSPSFIIRNMHFKKGDTYNQDNYAKTLNDFSRTGVWQSVIVQIKENKKNDSLDVIFELFPTKQYGFETNIEGSYSYNSNTNAATAINSGNLLGLSVNASLQNRNIGHKAVKMTQSVHAGLEFNVGSSTVSKVVNSTELGYSNTITNPRVIPLLKTNILPFLKKKPISVVSPTKKLAAEETFYNFNASYIDRIDLFRLQNIGLGFGSSWSSEAHPNRTKTVKIFNIEFSHLYDQSTQFKQLLDSPAFSYLRYSFNTALVLSSAYGYASSKIIKHNKNDFRFNLESSFPLSYILPVFPQYLRKFVKADIEYTNTKTIAKHSRVWHIYAGVGIPLSSNDSTLPFFKQYYSGGANSMRGWPIRGLGLGAQPLTDFNSSTTIFNDRTGDIKFEANWEYRFNIWQIIPNTLTLKGATFVDVGNIWDLKDVQVTTNNITQSVQFPLNFQKIWQQLAGDAGLGFRFDFNYFLIRCDLGFRFKRPDIPENDGLQFPKVTFNNLFNGADEYKKWRYENFNFTVGLNYPF